MIKTAIFPIFFLMLLMPFTAGADTGWYTLTINRIQVGYDERIKVFTNEPHGCNGGYQLNYDGSTGTELGRKMIYSALLAYEAQGKKVQFGIESCSGDVGIFNVIESTQ